MSEIGIHLMSYVYICSTTYTSLYVSVHTSLFWVHTIPYLAAIHINVQNIPVAGSDVCKRYCVWVVLLMLFGMYCSKLRQHLLTLKDQYDQWQRSVMDLKRREDLVDDWQRNHSFKGTTTPIHFSNTFTLKYTKSYTKQCHTTTICFQYVTTTQLYTSLYIHPFTSSL